MHIFSEIVRKSATAFIQLSTDFRQTIDFTFDFIKNSKNSTPSSMKTSFKFGFKRYNNLMKKIIKTTFYEAVRLMFSQNPVYSPKTIKCSFHGATD